MLKTHEISINLKNEESWKQATVSVLPEYRLDMSKLDVDKLTDFDLQQRFLSIKEILVFQQEVTALLENRSKGLLDLSLSPLKNYVQDIQELERIKDKIYKTAQGEYSAMLKIVSDLLIESEEKYPEKVFKTVPVSWYRRIIGLKS